MTTKKQGAKRGAAGDRPRMKTSHEKIADGAKGARSKTKATRGASRAGAGVAVLPKDDPTPTRPSVAKHRFERAAQPAKVRAGRDVSRSQSHEDRSSWGSIASTAARETATAIALAALEKKAVGVEILDVAGKVDYADFVVIMTGRSDRQVQALAQGIEEALRKKGQRPIAIEGLHHGSWVLMDFADVVVHVFQDESRRLYDIEGLWLDAQRLPVPSSTHSE